VQPRERRSLAFAEQQVANLQRENESLKMRNARLTAALVEATVRGSTAHWLARHDELTGLPNRLSLNERLQEALAAAERHQCQPALLFIDLDGFKTVNDRFGHIVGDRLLAAVAKRIVACTRADDIAYRYGGDEFVVLLPNVHDVTVAAGIAEEIRSHVGRRYSIDTHELHVTASIGVALYPVDGERSETLLSRADSSMYRNKSSLGTDLFAVAGDRAVGIAQH
jgi:diguanylate cyclase (GGDEF)-like protein